LDQLAAIPLITQGPPPSAGSTGRPPGQLAKAPVNSTLASLTEFQLTSDVGGIVRIDGRRVNEVKAYIQAGVLPSIVMESFKTRLMESDFSLPEGYTLEFGGETEQRSNAVRSLIANAIVLFALMLMTLVASFRSFRCAIIIACVGGLSVGLGPLALFVFGYPFGFMAIVGTMGLVGVAINDSIVVLAAIRGNQPSLDGNVVELTRVVSGCTRHIIATTLTTIVGFLPLILTGGGFWPPLAIAIAGGVGAATFLALYFVPALHLLLFRKNRTAVRGSD
jgi:multidrug efflux pump subunit AcrB